MAHCLLEVGSLVQFGFQPLQKDLKVMVYRCEKQKQPQPQLNFISDWQSETRTI